MAVYEYRSLNGSLNEGATDGKYRKVRPNTTVDPGQGDELVRANRRGLNPYWNYDFIDSEAPAKVNPGSNKAASGRTPQLGNTPVFGIEAATQQYN
jgi:hypothetical protein